MNAFPDTLVLKIEEYDSLNLVDTTLYILYDQQIDRFVIRGRRRDTEKVKSVSYSFECEFAHELADFITFIICKKNAVTYVLYNYNNLPFTSNEITYAFLARCDTPRLRNESYELAAYDRCKLRKREVTEYLRMLRNVANPY
jgi:hypothetical protein